MAKVKVIDVRTPHESLRVAVLDRGGEVKWWAKQTVYSDIIKPDAEIDLEVEKKEGKYGEERWVKSVNGQTAQQKQGFGGGRPAAPPRDEDVIVAQVIIKEACESARMNATRESRALDLNEVRVTAKALVDIYHDTHKALKVTA